MKTALIVVCIALLLCLINYATDSFFAVKDVLARYHIGRWDKKAWKSAVEKKATRWLRRTPVVKITDNSRYILLDALSGKYQSSTIQSWQKAALILGLLESDKEESVSKALNYASELTDERGDWKEKPTRVDCGMLSFALLRAAEDPAKIRKAMDYSASLIKGNLNEQDMISYTCIPDDPDMYVDTIGLCCPFLVLYANAYGLPEYEKIAYRQIECYRTYGTLKGTSLPNHAFHLHSKLPLGVYGWGRGIAWYGIGLLDSYLSMKDGERKARLGSWIREAAESYKIFQRKDGGFGSIIQSGKTYDSSATAGLAWFYSVCYSLFDVSEYRVIAEKSLEKLLKCTRVSGAIDFCQGDTKGIGVFSQTYDIMPFAQGMCLRAIHQLERK